MAVPWALGERSIEPGFLWVSVSSPHPPFWVLGPHEDMPGRSDFQEMRTHGHLWGNLVEGQGAVRHMPGDLSSSLALEIALTIPHLTLDLSVLLWKTKVFRLHDF